MGPETLDDELALVTGCSRGIGGPRSVRSSGAHLARPPCANSAATIGRGANRRRTHPDSRQFIRRGRECDRRSRRTTLVAAISLTAAPAAQDNAAWLTGEVLAGEAAATLDPEDLTIRMQRCSAFA
jgi:hypothetical protein